jgi:hypothetical protein
VQLICGERADCKGYGGSLIDHSKQQQHADKHDGYCHLEREMHSILENFSI